MNVSLRPASAADWDLIRPWLRRPDALAAWGPRGQVEAEIGLALGAGRTAAVARIIELDGEPCGYVHALEHDGKARGSWHVGVIIGRPAELTGERLGLALARLKSEVFTTTFALTLAAEPAVAAETAVRALESAGFTWQHVMLNPRRGAAWLMLCERP